MTEHELATLRRRVRGRSVDFNRPVYGYTVGCTCGWTQRVNDRKPAALAAFKDHKKANERSNP